MKINIWRTSLNYRKSPEYQFITDNVAERVNGILKDEIDIGGIFPYPAMARRETKTVIEFS